MGLPAGRRAIDTTADARRICFPISCMAGCRRILSELRPIMKIDFELNGSPRSIECEPEKPLLWVLREDLHLTGAKYGCGVAQCGCCTVHLDGDAVRSCVTPIQRVKGRKVTTIEGLSPDGGHPVQKAWL